MNNNPEFIKITVDLDKKVINCIRTDGSHVYYTDVEFKGNIIFNDIEYSIIESPEWLKCIVDSDNKIIFGIDNNGKTYADLYGVDKKLQETIDEINAEVDDKLALFNSLFELIDNSEYICIELDSSNHILGGRYKDGTSFENIGIKTNNVNISENNITTIHDDENRISMVLDNDKKIIAYRDDNGSLHENTSIYTPSINLSEDGLKKLSYELDIPLPETFGLYKTPNLPKFGITNIKTETFYLTSVPGLNDLSQTTIIQDVDDTDANAADRMTICHYYFSNIRLRHYAAGRVSFDVSTNKYYASETIRKVDNIWYYADTLGYLTTNSGSRTKVIDGYTEIYNGSDIPQTGDYNLIKTEVIGFTGPANVNTWTIEDYDVQAVKGTDIGKKYEHWCTASIDFEYYLSYPATTSKNIAYVGVKHQGNSTQGYRKRNFRYTFYKKSDYDKKDKIKIGEMLRLSKFNLKANWTDNTKVKELILYRIFNQIWQNRPIVDRYNWDNKINGLYHGVTGNIQGFPIELDVNGEFYGMYVFCLPKDGKNYFIDDKDEDTGLFVSGAHNTSNDWGVELPYIISSHYDSEMDKDDFSKYPKIVESLENWTHFINNRLYNGSDGQEYNITQLTNVDGNMYVTSTLIDGQVTTDSIKAEIIPFDKDNIPERLDVLGFIDYFICMQLFVMVDNTHNNLMMYAGPEKKKMYPFFYDLDLSIEESHGFDCNILEPGISYSRDMSLWINFSEIYWDDIINRYCQLRKTYLSIDYIKNVYNDILKDIPESESRKETIKWGKQANPKDFDLKISFIENRLLWLDKNYFKI